MVLLKCRPKDYKIPEPGYADPIFQVPTINMFPYKLIRQDIDTILNNGRAADIEFTPTYKFSEYIQLRTYVDKKHSLADIYTILSESTYLQNIAKITCRKLKSKPVTHEFRIFILI